MNVKISIDENLINEAKSVGKHNTNIEAVREALMRYIKVMKQKDITELIGTIEYDDNYDYKKQRKIS